VVIHDGVRVVVMVSGSPVRGSKSCKSSTLYTTNRAKQGDIPGYDRKIGHLGGGMPCLAGGLARRGTAPVAPVAPAPTPARGKPRG
jgi:hypothetical protein